LFLDYQKGYRPHNKTVMMDTEKFLHRGF